MYLIQSKLDNFLLAYRATPRAITGQTTSELFIGGRINTRIDLIKPDNSIGEKVEKQPTRTFVVDENVFIKKYIQEGK